MTPDLPPPLAERLPALRAAAHGEPLGLYLHIPFCLDRCTYCSFATTRDRDLQPATIRRLTAQVRAWGEALERPAVDTLYLGGGTPSLLSPGELAALTAALRDAFDLSPLVEATFEANPGTVDLGWLQGARDLGWDRVSLGVQALDDALLARLGRIHGAAQALEALGLAEQVGFRRRSADLMVGIPGQSLSKVIEDARALAATGIDHLSIYLLDLDKACPLRAEIDAGRLALPSEDEVADVFEALQAELPPLGLVPYEISNYARPGGESIHNTRYWERRPYLGLGPSAASQMGAFRWTETSVIPAWTQGRGRLDFQELGAAEALAEIPLLGLRLHRGVDWGALRQKAGDLNLRPLADGWEARLRALAMEGLTVWEGDRVRLSPRGMLMSNGILEMFV
ncbi:coproporphyrinogen-III oxidase family protein [Geothrix alkalitolerans]|uniref:coproporphyrinogen-III oxidase family protein n=1 Tax=Geothrix alkalitolerans TaxID=2922724 RepID=UPI001FAFDCBB|nr:coproporphyrinogen-III oxidase family protein [Geothrix alkalitolerans]